MELFQAMVAAIQWNPNREILTIPYINLPLTWYGFLFAFGFWLGFHLFISIFKQYLALKPEFISSDVNWSGISYYHSQEIEQLKKKDLGSCNALLRSQKDLKQLKLSPPQKKLVDQCAKIKGEAEADLLKKRLLLEQKYPKLFVSLYQRARDFAEKLIFYVVIATVFGARLGHLIFYEHPKDYLLNPLEIFKTWEGGLASHGGILAIIIAIGLFYRSSRKQYSDFSFYRLLDGVAIPTMLVSSMIRIGNFINQEILGKATDLPWGVVFMHPADGSAAIARHPAQLYEAFFYFSVFAFLYFLWKRNGFSLRPGRYAGVAIFASFTFRFFIEFIKSGQSHWFDTNHSLLLMGQLLSLPLAFIGVYLLINQRTSTSKEA